MFVGGVKAETTDDTIRGTDLSPSQAWSQNVADLEIAISITNSNSYFQHTFPNTVKLKRLLGQ